MRAAVVTKFGAPDVLNILEMPVPQPKHGEVLIQTKAVGLNFADVMGRLGLYPGIPNPPFVPGIELAGFVEKVGDGVKNLRAGDRVVAFSRQGAYAEYVCANAAHVKAIPAKMEFEEAAAFGVTYLSAYHALVTLANMQKGEKLLLHAAAGGVGTAAIQIGKHLGIEIFATASSGEKLDVARQQGAHHLINYQTEDFEKIVRSTTDGYGIDVVLDSVGGKVFRKGWKLLAPMGRYVLYGFASVTGQKKLNKIKALSEFLSIPFIFPPTIVSKNVALMGFNIYFLTHKIDYLNRVATVLFDWYEKGIIKPVIGKTFALGDIVEAHTFLQSRKSVGKVVVVV